jgi:DinB superfamily
MMTDEQQRIRSYLQTQGAKQTPADIIAKVEAAMADLENAARAVPAARFTERPEPEEWSANEVLAHVVTADRYFGGGIVAILGDRPAPPRGGGRGIEDAPSRSADEWLDILRSQRSTLFDRVRAADPGARLDVTIEHPFFGPLNWRETLLFTRLHDLDHAGQLGKIAASFGAPPAPGRSRGVSG